MDRSRRVIILACVLLAVLEGWVFYHYWPAQQGSIASLSTGNNTDAWGADYAAFKTALHNADAIDDPLQRCLHTPDLPGAHWNKDTSATYCRLRALKTISLDEVDAMLKQHKSAELDRIFQSYLDQQQHDPSKLGVLDEAFIHASFEDDQPATRAIIEEWKRQAPASAFAMTASGTLHISAAWNARGEGWSRDLTDAQVETMHQQLALAQQDLDRALAKQPAMTPAYVAIVEAAGLFSDDDYVEQAAKRAVAIDPGNFSLRLKMLDKAQQKWGSFFGGEDEQVREAAALQDKYPLMRLMVGQPRINWLTCGCNTEPVATSELLPAVDQGAPWGDLKSLANIAYNNHSPRLAIELYSEALRFYPQDPESLRWRARMLLSIGDSQGAIDSIVKAEQRFPDDNDIAVELGRLYKGMNRIKDAATTLEAVVQRDPNNEDAMAELGDLYSHAGNNPDKALAIAATLIERYPDKADGYIVRACVQMDHQLPGRYDTIHQFIDRFGDSPDYRQQTAELRNYLINHPEKIGS